MRIPPTSIINLIRNDLNDRYKAGFPVIKELIQNADDAFSTRVELIHAMGIEGADNPLLTGPAMVVVDNGQFTEDNAYAIDCIGISSKPDNKNAVGKFGLGLKSVFHLCEAFLYISSLDTKLHVVNPWADNTGRDEINPGWGNETLGDYFLVQDYLSSVISGEQFFCLWIPLRKEIHIQQRHAITPEFPGDNGNMFGFPQAQNPASKPLELQLSQLMPLLKHITEIRGWFASHEGCGKRFEVLLTQNSSRRKFPDMQFSDSYELNAGDVSVAVINDRKKKLLYSGAEILLKYNIFNELMDSDKWPKYSFTDPQTGAPREKRDNALPHASATFLATPANQETNEVSLRVQQAVFLPLDQSGETIPIAAGNQILKKQDITLFLHGCFFVDAGRLKVEWDSPINTPVIDSTSLRQKWNSNLLHQGVMPGILPALNQFVGEFLDPSHDYVKQLTQAIQHSELFKTYRKSICHNQQWVFVVSGDNQTWKLLDATRKIYTIPEPPRSHNNRPFLVLPGLKKLQNLAYFEYPSLTALELQNDWDHFAILDALDHFPVEEVFTDQGKLTYFISFLQHAISSMSSSTGKLGDRLIQIAQEAISKVGFEKLRANRVLVVQFFSMLPVERCLVLRINQERWLRDELLERMLRNLASAVNGVILPPDFVPGNTQSINYPIKLAAPVLQSLNSQISEFRNEERAIDLISEMSCFIIGNTINKAELRSQIWDYKIFKTTLYSLAEQRFISVLRSWREIDDLKGQGILFRHAADGDVWLRDLQETLPEIRLVLISSEVKDAFSLNDVGICDAESSVRILNNGPKLAKPKCRKNLLVRLLQLNRIDQRDYIRAIRYLLHAYPNGIWKEKELFADTPGDIWCRLIRIALNELNENWRLVPIVLAEQINAQQGQWLQIIDISPSCTAKLFDSLQPSSVRNIDLASFSNEERKIILRNFVDQPDLLKILPVHESISGGLVSIREFTYLDGGFSLDHDLLQSVSMLKAPADDMITAIYRRIGVSTIEPIDVIKIILNRPQVYTHSETLIEALKRVEIGDLSESLFTRLREAKWLPAERKGFVQPDHVLAIDGLNQTIFDILLEVDEKSMVTIFDLSPSIRDETIFVKIRSLFPSKQVTLDYLSVLLNGLDKYRLGILEQEQINPVFLNNLTTVFQGSNGKIIMPAAEIIKSVMESTDHAVHFATELVGPIQSKRYIDILTFLSGQHKISVGDEKRQYLWMFNKYLHAIVELPDYKNEILPKIKLLSRGSESEWKPTNQLCANVEGVDLSHLLNENQMKILKLDTENVLISQENQQEMEESRSEYITRGSQVAKELEKYFAGWETRINHREIIGGFLCWLGDQQNIKQLAKNYLNKRSVEETRKIISWEKLDYKNQFGNVIDAGPSMEKRVEKQVFWLRVIEEQEELQIVKSLVGTEFRATLLAQNRLKHLIYFDGNINPQVANDGIYIDYLCLRKINPELFDPNQLSGLLKETVATILMRFFHQPVNNIDEYWAELERTDQLDIEIAQDWILESSFSYIPQLGLKTDETFSRLIKRWEEARVREIESRQNVRRHSDPTSQYSAEKEKLRIISDFRNNLESDKKIGDETRGKLLDAVRRKVGRDYQYKPRSILYELFQNADDALIELEILNNGRDIDTLHRKVVISKNEGSLTFVHWGRAINQVFPEAYPGQGRARGYDSDLIKMLMMQVSDKYISHEVDSSEKLTGKFGLGFKSVFLLADQPLVLSGRLKFKILGGLYPQRLGETEYSDLYSHLQSIQVIPGQNETAFYLPFGSDGNNEVARSAFDEFVQHSYILIGFSKAIQKIELIDGGGKKIIQANLQALSTEKIWHYGKLYSADNHTHILLMKSKNGSILFKLGPRGFRSLDNDIPTIWVTTPTESAGFGYAINADFDLDVGRAQLASASERNLKIACDLGRKLGDGLMLLYKLVSDDWASICQQLDFEREVTPYEFWQSLWYVVSEPLSREHGDTIDEVVRQIFGTKECGLRILSESFDCIPTDLPGKYGVLTRIQHIKYVTSPEMEEEEVFKVIEAWTGFQREIAAGNIISTKMSQSLKRVIKDRQNWLRLSLSEIISFDLSLGEKVSPETAIRMGGLITPEFLRSLPHNISQEVSNHLKTLLFLGQDNQWHPARDLLVSEKETRDTEDERLRSQFAPNSRKLSKEYKNLALPFFRACRGRLSADVETIAKWALDASSEVEQLATLEYIVRGELSYDLARFLKNDETVKIQFQYSWLSSIPENIELLPYLDPHDISVIFGRLGLVEKPNPENIHPHNLPSDSLEKVYDWWIQNQSELLAEYEEDVYPGGKMILPSDQLVNEQARTDWIKLFLLGTYHTIGRTKPKAYRNFIEDCEDRNWFEVFIQEEQDANKWIGVLDEYLERLEEEDDPKYQYLFARQFISIFQISNHLNNYVELFLMINRANEPFTLDQFLNPNTNPILIGAGFPGTPLLSRIMGFGASFVFRDLVRSGVIHNRFTYEHCFAPIRRMREIFSELGVPSEELSGVDGSRRIYRFLGERLGKEKAIFNLAFDIPFLMIHKKFRTISNFISSYGG